MSLDTIIDFLSDLLLPQSLILILFAYGLGSIPFGLIIAKKITGQDVRSKGSGNIGATNVSRISGKKLGLITLLLDVAKGFLPIFLAFSLQLPSNTAITIGLFAVIGHCFPAWLRFMGGKGVATGFGVILAYNFHIALLAFIIFIVVALVAKRVDIGSIVGSLSILALSIFLVNASIDIAVIAIIVFIVIAKHYTNLKSLLK